MGEEERQDPQPEEAEMMERLQEELQKLTVSDHLLYMMQSLSALATGRMGLTAETVERRDLEQARLAIDAFKALMEVAERTRPAQEMAVHRGALSQLQLAYVGAQRGSASEDAPEERPEDPLEEAPESAPEERPEGGD
ncbi:MAG: hypothetical protein V1912_10650 [bacterium]